ncbi:MAG: hypothetical protein WAZ94_12185, partial [Phycisphaerales bacterium]
PSTAPASRGPAGASVAADLRTPDLAARSVARTTAPGVGPRVGRTEAPAAHRTRPATRADPKP